MDNLKDRLYNYEEMPPSGVWQEIAYELDKTAPAVIPINRRKNKILYYSLAAASVAIIVFCFIFFNRNAISFSKEDIVSSPSSNSRKFINTDTGALKDDHVIMTVPSEEDNTSENKEDEKMLANNTPQKGGGPLIEKDSEDIKADSSNSEVSDKNSNYLTIAGPEGQSINVSAKMATLIDSSDNKVPPKPVWNKKIKEWKEIMKANTLAATPGNFLDIVELTKALKDK